MTTDTHLFMVSFDGWTAHWMDGGFTEVDTLFIAVATEQEARPIAVKNSRYLDADSKMEIVDLGLTDRSPGHCTDDWSGLTEAHYEIIVDSMPSDESALETLCYAATGDDPDDDPRKWTGAR